MKQVSALLEQIRGYVNDVHLYEKHFHSNLDEWNALCVAMDTLCDTCEALDYYETHEWGEGIGEKYLKLYGFLQAIFLQQDSINELHKAFLKTGIRPRFDTAWKIIRELRNLTVGHPIEKKDKDGIKRCFIFQLTIKEANLQLLVWNKSKGKNGRSEFENIQLSSLYEKYKSEAVKILKSICQEQVRIWSALP